MSSRQSVACALFCALAWGTLVTCMVGTAQGLGPPELGDQPAQNDINGPAYQGEIAALQSSETMDFVDQWAGSVQAVAVQGDRAYIGAARRLLALDVSSPNNPALIARSPLLSDTVQGVCVADGYAYVADGTAGLLVMDLADPTALRVSGSLRTGGNARNVYVVDGYAYVAGGWAGMEIIDVSNPAVPRPLGSLGTHAEAQDVYVLGGSAYVAAGQAGLRVIRVSDPALAVEVGFYDTPGQARQVTVRGTLAYIADCEGGLRIVDVSSASQPREVGFYDVNGCAESVHVSSTLAYVGVSFAGLRVLDVSDPSRPSEASTWPPTLIGCGVTNVFPSVVRAQVSGGYAYVACADGGLRVLDVSSGPAPIEASTYAGALTSLHVAGRYAYLSCGTYECGRSGLYVVDLLSPGSPRPVGMLPLAASRMRVSGSRMYVLDASYGLEVLDVSTPSDPVPIGIFLDRDWRPNDIAIQGGYGIAVGVKWDALNHIQHDGLQVFNVSDPVHITEVALLDLPGSPARVTVAADYAYVAAGPDGLRVIDISNPLQPAEVGLYDTPGHASDVALASHYAYVADSEGGLAVVDVSDPAHPALVHTVNSSPGIFSIAVDHDLAWAGCYAAGVRVFDIANPAQPVEVGSYDTAHMAYSVSASGPYAYVADGTAGLATLWFSPSASVTVTSAGGALTSSADGITYNFAPHTFANPVTVTHRARFPDATAVPPDTVRVGQPFQISVVYLDTGEVAQASKPYTMTVRYSLAGTGPVAEDTLRLCYWDGAEWVAEATSRVDTTNQTVRAYPDRFRLWTLLGDQAHFTPRAYLPAVFKVAPRDLAVVGLEVTQSVQDAANSMPLVAGRPTMARVYVDVTGDVPVNGIFVSLAALRDGAHLSGSPLVLGPLAVYPAQSRGVYGHSFNAVLPPAWLSGQWTLSVTVDPDNDLAEAHRGNNTVSTLLAFRSVPPLNVTIVPVNYTQTLSGHTYPGQALDVVSNLVGRMFPVSAVNVAFRVPADFAGDPSDHGMKSRLLEYVAALKQADGAPASQVYHGLVVDDSGDACDILTGGLGYVGIRVSISGACMGPTHDLDTAEETAAHEIGHNLGRGHVPCGTSGDPGYPYAQGSIGQYGFDLARMHIWSPYFPDHAKDFMSYCDPAWVSDYTYRALYEDQLAHGIPQAYSAMTQTLLVRVSFDEQGGAKLQPVYVLRGLPTELPASSSHSLELLDSAGRVVAAYPLPVYVAEDGDVRAQSIVAGVPCPDKPVASVRLLYDGRLVAFRALMPAKGVTAATLEMEQNGMLVLRWGPELSPALVRYKVDGSTSWTTLGLDLPDGELSINPTALPRGTGRFEVVVADTFSLVTPTVSPSLTLRDSAP